MPAWSGEGPVPGHRLLTVSSMVEGARELSGVSFLRALIPFTHAFMNKIVSGFTGTYFKKTKCPAPCTDPNHVRSPVTPAALD